MFENSRQHLTRGGAKLWHHLKMFFFFYFCSRANSSSFLWIILLLYSLFQRWFLNIVTVGMNLTKKKILYSKVVSELQSLEGVYSEFSVKYTCLMKAQSIPHNIETKDLLMSKFTQLKKNKLVSPFLMWSLRLPQTHTPPSNKLLSHFLCAT